MPLIRGANVTHSSGVRATNIVTDGTHLYTPTRPNAGTPSSVFKTTISPFAETGSVTLDPGEEGAIDIAYLSGHVYTTHDPFGGAVLANAGLVVKVAVPAMTRIGATQLWSPSPTSLRSSISAYSDGSFLYIGSGAYDPGSGYLATQVTKMDGSFGSQTTLSLPSSLGSTTSRMTFGDGNYIYVAISASGAQATDQLVKIDASTMTHIATLNLPFADRVNCGLLIPPKYYIGTKEGSPATVLRVDTNSMTLDETVITMGSSDGNVAWLMASGNILYVANEGNASITSSVVFTYDLLTFYRTGSLPSIASQTGPGIFSGLFGPGTQNTTQYWALYGTAMTTNNQIQQTRNIYVGSVLTFPNSQQNAFGGSPGVLQSVPRTRKDIAPKTSNISSGSGVTTQISSANPYLQASAMGDPHFYGFEGENWFFNGQPGSYYNLFTDEGIQINSLFRHWETSGGANFTAMEEIGITIITNKIPKIKNNKRKLLGRKMGELIKIKITANHGISVNGEYVCDSLDPILEFLKDSKEYFTEEEIDKFNRTEGYGVFLKAQIIRFLPYHFIITQSTYGGDAPYLNIIARLDGAAENRPHGIIGQTADFDGKPKAHWDGEDCDYKVSDLWASDFKFNKFRGV